MSSLGSLLVETDIAADIFLRLVREALADRDEAKTSRARTLEVLAERNTQLHRASRDLEMESARAQTAERLLAQLVLELQKKRKGAKVLREISELMSEEWKSAWGIAA